MYVVSLESRYISRQVKIISGSSLLFSKNKKSIQFFLKRRHETLMLNIFVRRLGHPFRFHTVGFALQLLFLDLQTGRRFH